MGGIRRGMQQDRLKNSFGLSGESGQSQSSSFSKPSDTIESYQYDPIVWLYYGAYGVLRGSYVFVKLVINSHALLRGIFRESGWVF